MSIRVSPQADLPAQEKRALDEALTAFYRNPPPSYYRIADENAGHYTRETTPFHCDLIDRVSPGMRVLELGCGTAHLCPHVEAQGAHYTGMDHSPELLAENQRRFPKARFLPIQSSPEERFDLVASLYTIEHVVDPPTYLERLLSFVKPGGLIAVICPEFIDGECVPPSFFFGHTARRLREKLTSFSFGDALAHLLDLKLRAPRWHQAARAAAPGAFWINLQPRVLHGAEYSIDGDAVHLPRLADIRWWLEKRGATIEATAQTLPGIPAEVLRYNGYVVARAPQG